MPGYAPAYNLKAVVKETGLSPATLRAWERRYGLIKPQRSAGGHRLYSEHDIEMLKWLVAKQKDGMSISNAVELWRSQAEGGRDPLQPAQAAQVRAGAPGKMLDDLRSDWIKACLAYDEQTAEQLLGQAFAIAAPEVVCSEVLQKGLAEIGNGWYAASASVQQEHFASALAMRRLHALFAAAPAPTRSGRILAACPPGEQHELVLLMLSFLLRRRGWDVVYLGANLPLISLDDAMQHISARLVLSVAQTLTSAASLQEMAQYVNAHGVALAYGGGIFNRVPDLRKRISGYFLGEDLASAPQAVEQLLAKMPLLPEIQATSLESRRALEKFIAQEALIVESVTGEMLSKGLEPGHLDAANINLTRSIRAALSLGNINFMDHAIGWLEGLLENYGLSPSLARGYLAAYRRAVWQHLGAQGELILEWLENVERAD